MASIVASIPVAGSSLAFPTGCVRSASRGFTQRMTFETASSPVPRQANSSRLVAVRAAADSSEKTLTGVVFEPFREVQSQSLQLPKNPDESLARQRFQVSCESAINDQINVEYNVSYIYHAMFSYFDRDNIALPGLAKYFKEASEEEREHAEKLMKYQNKRGGRVKLLSIILPPMEFANSEKGDALYAMELTLSLEKLTTEKLYTLHKVAEEMHDVQLTDYIESEYLAEQIEAIKKVSEYVAQLRRIGQDGHGVYYWDRVLLEEGA
jgi:ferritin heavy chain